MEATCKVQKIGLVVDREQRFSNKLDERLRWIQNYAKCPPMGVDMLKCQKPSECRSSRKIFRDPDLILNRRPLVP